jgi:hypothetical protein
MTVWYLANTNTFREVADRFNVSKSSAHRVISTIVSYLMREAPKYIYWPNQNDRKIIKNGFKNFQGITGIVGAIDGTHIKIKKPNSDHVHVYCNRKGDFSILMQAVCDHNKRFRDIFVGEAGSIHDSRLLKKSALYQKGLNGFFGNDFLLGDSAYPCLEWLVPPFKDNGNLSRQQNIFNFRHSSSRIIIENAFGLLKSRFRRLRCFENNNIAFIVRCIIAATVLYNICIDFDDEIEWENEDDSADDYTDEYVQNVSGIEFRTTKRDQIFREMFP